ncbi:polysaccharide deacetylase family protein [Cohnella sp.]|uniref:polysaccharide deacetylase family protein n=1 Tax=Cohnella sp. TaxID=1883426 RepID=UPI0035646EF3
MIRRMSPKLLAAMLLCLLVVLFAGTYGPLKPFVQAVKPQAAYVSSVQTNNSDDQLLTWIKSEAAKKSQAPINAVIDRIWKAIPGYDGRVVDIQATYQKAKLIGAMPGSEGDFPWVYREIRPKINLSDLPIAPIYRGNSAKPMVALMINVAWGDEYLLPMLDILKDSGVKATFFFDGSWLSKHADLAKSIMAQGHEVSNHAYSHPNMSQLSDARQREEIAKTEALLKKLGVINVWFAPPSGDYNDRTVKLASELGLRTVLWTLDTLDWKKPEPSTVVAKVSKQVSPGSLILMHPTATSQGALRGMINVIKGKGYSLGTVSETLSSDRA